MSTINVTDINGETCAIEFKNGFSLMETLREQGYEEILAICGGNCSCATCHVYVDDSNCANLEPIEEDELELLELTENYSSERSRLSCQIELKDDYAGLQVSILEPE